MSTPAPVTLQAERIHDLWTEMMPILERHRAEVAHYKDIPLGVDRARYEILQDAGMLWVFTMREGGTLIGYNVFVVAPNLHYTTALAAIEDVLYLDPSRRALGLGRKMLQWIDEHLAKRGCTYVARHVKLAHDHGALLKRAGYEPVETIWQRRLAGVTAPQSVVPATAQA